ncbi:MAG TPA: hypothetical protein VNB23_06710 [Ramlibacter sp.]|nr:hypothetical protein [Ramlibacter sp.]
MKTLAFKMLPALAAAAALVACGGDDARPPSATVQMSGTAATGAPVAGGKVAVTCGTAAAVNGTTAADGKWSVDLHNPTFPCHVGVTGGSLPPALALSSFALDALVVRNVNVTPLTTLIFADMMNSVQSVMSNITRTTVDTVTNRFNQQLQAAGFSPPPDPFHGVFAPNAGDPHDDLIESLMRSLRQQGITLNELAEKFTRQGAYGAYEIVPPSVVAFDSLPAPFPANIPSYGPEAYALTSLGDLVKLKAGTPRKLRAVTVAMSSWACQSGGWNTENCMSDAGATFTHPITLKIYSESGTLLATRTQTFTAPYRPSMDETCEAGRWKAPDGTCYNGKAFTITFDMTELAVTLPDTVKYELSYNTRTQGPQPLGVAGPYDSLNMAVYDSTAVTPAVGSDQDPGYLHWNGQARYEQAGLMAQFHTGQ